MEDDTGTEKENVENCDIHAHSKPPDDVTKKGAETENKEDDVITSHKIQSSKALISTHEEETPFRVIYNKAKHDVSFPLSMTVIDLKAHLEPLIGVPQAMQKVMIRGLAKDDRTLQELGVTKGSKIMVVGSKLDDVLAVSKPAPSEVTSQSSATSSKEPLSKQKIHRKVLDKGVPEDAMPGICNLKEALPQYPLTGMLNKAGGKVRLTFKLELDQLWIGSKERTEKIAMNSIKMVVSEPIEEHPHFHMLAFQLGPTEASRYWVYWVPAQYVDAIKEAVLGAW